jgi:hypothetical protein
MSNLLMTHGTLDHDIHLDRQHLHKGIMFLVEHTTTCLHGIMDKCRRLIDSQSNYHTTMKYILLLFPSFNHCERYAH